VPARQYSGCRLRHRTPPASRAAQAKREASEGWTTRASSEDTRGELLRTKRGAVPEEGVSDRDKPSLSRETGEAISIQRASRKPTCKGGGETWWVTRRQRRSREWSETARWTRVDLAAVLKRHAHRARGPKPLLVAVRPVEADPARRETTDPPIEPFIYEWVIRSGTESAGAVQEGSGWQKSVGRIVVLTRDRGCLARGRSWSRERASRHERGRTGAQSFRGIFHRAP